MGLSASGGGESRGENGWLLRLSKGREVRDWSKTTTSMRCHSSYGWYSLLTLQLALFVGAVDALLRHWLVAPHSTACKRAIDTATQNNRPMVTNVCSVTSKHLGSWSVKFCLHPKTRVAGRVHNFWQEHGPAIRADVPAALLAVKNPDVQIWNASVTRVAFPVQCTV